MSSSEDETKARKAAKVPLRQKLGTYKDPEVIKSELPFSHLQNEAELIPMAKMGDYSEPIGLVAIAEKVKQFPLFETDLFICTYPKSGTTWMQQIVYFLATRDFEGGNKVTIDERVPELEIPPPYPPTEENLERIKDLPHPRMYKSHFAPSLLPHDYLTKQPKTVYVYRNPKDTVVSNYYFYRAWTPSLYKGTFSEFLELFMQDKVPFGPYATHLREWYEYSKKPEAGAKHVMYISYEELIADRLAGIRKIDQFLGTNNDEATLVKVSEQTSFDFMKKSEGGSYKWMERLGFYDSRQANFMRKGKVGDWRNHFSEEQRIKFDAWCQEKLAGIELNFKEEVAEK